ncbi:MBL fold metallo-hydrolase [Pseudanabaena sp. PCC 6802]|uniref:MBL fold metallo-hydrolase n=1 Tax=Pseudanabaena sp. PCC 6802 TaxID=118173 RepID=UPI00034B1456|nr:MBL fold metallo-hydrolase [Pseudanabaena sp. PCC 6802]
MLFRQLFDLESSTYTYLIADPNLQEAILVDPVLEQVERDRALLNQLGLTLRYCLETHVHADHITGTDRLRADTGCLGVVPERAHVSCADRHIKDGEILELGAITIQAIATPGHTDSHMAYLVGSDRLKLNRQTANVEPHLVLTGDALLIRGCGRTDFQSGNAGILYDSVTQRLFALPDETLVYPAHDYRGHTVSTIGEEKRWNPRFVGRDRQNFIEFMNALNLPDPKKMMEAVPANELCGRAVAIVNLSMV